MLGPDAMKATSFPVVFIKMELSVLYIHKCQPSSHVGKIMLGVVSIDLPAA